MYVRLCCWLHTHTHATHKLTNSSIIISAAGFTHTHTHTHTHLPTHLPPHFREHGRARVRSRVSVGQAEAKGRRVEGGCVSGGGGGCVNGGGAVAEEQ